MSAANMNAKLYASFFLIQLDETTSQLQKVNDAVGKIS